MDKIECCKEMRFSVTGKKSGVKQQQQQKKRQLKLMNEHFVSD